MLIRFWLGRLHIGRPSGITGAPYDMAVTLCWGWRGDVPLAAPQWRHLWRFSWDWLPIRFYQSINAVKPPEHPALTKIRQTVSVISGKDQVSPNSETLLPSEFWGAIDSSRWTGRDRRFVGFGQWRHSFLHYRATWRSLMHVYLTGAKERANPKHIMYIAPATQVPRAECPSEWLNEDNTVRNFTVEFKFGRASVDERLGEWLVKSGHAKKSNIVRATTGSLVGSLARTIQGR